MGIGLCGLMGSLDVDWSSWRRVAWMMVVVDRRHAAVRLSGCDLAGARVRQADAGVRS